MDLGCGTGRLSIASAFFGASVVVSVDIDLDALYILRENIINLEIDHLIHPICSDVQDISIAPQKLENYYQNITTIMNPPFGVQKRMADRIFLEKAFIFSDTIYSIHLSGEGVKSFISRFAQKHDWKIDLIIPYNMLLERSFPFHEQKTKKIDVSVYRLIKN